MWTVNVMTITKQKARVVAKTDIIVVAVVMPCLNEAATVGLCIEKAQLAFARLGIAGEVVVADDGSSDDSIRVGQSLGARVVREPRKGYGAALISQHACRARARRRDGRRRTIPITRARLGDFMCKIEEGYDLVIGDRLGQYIARCHAACASLSGQSGAVGAGACHVPHSHRGQFTAACARCGSNRSARSTSGRRAWSLRQRWWCARRGGAAHAQIPTRLYPDKRGRPPHLRSFRDGWRHLRFMFATYAPDWLLP